MVGSIRRVAGAAWDGVRRGIQKTKTCVGVAAVTVGTVTGSALAQATYTPYGDDSVRTAISGGMADEGANIWLTLAPVMMFFAGIGLTIAIVKGYFRGGGR